MMLEVLAAAVLAVILLWMVLGPLMRPVQQRPHIWEPPDPEETPRGAAVAALREIEFDRETGKLSETDYADLKARYTREAVAAQRGEERATAAVAGAGGVGPASDVEAMIAARARAIAGGAAPPCRICGPRPEPDAVYCSTCGRPLETGHHCGSCGAVLPPGSNFCESCGARVAA